MNPFNGFACGSPAGASGFQPGPPAAAGDAATAVRASEPATAIAVTIVRTVLRMVGPFLVTASSPVSVELDDDRSRVGRGRARHDRRQVDLATVDAEHIPARLLGDRRLIPVFGQL